VSTNHHFNQPQPKESNNPANLSMLLNDLVNLFVTPQLLVKNLHCKRRRFMATKALNY